MRRSSDKFALGIYRSRLGLLMVSSLLATLLGVVAFGGESEARANDGEFLAREGTPPPGANVPCKPSAKHPYPVVLVHGTFETMEQNWAVLSPRLKERGYCVFALNYGDRGLEAIGDSGRELGRFVDNVMEFTGTKKVSLVGHSQGGMMPRRWIQSQNAGNKVDDLIGLAPSNYGTELGEATSENSTAEDFGLPMEEDSSETCRACDQQAAGSPFLKRLNRGDDTLGTASYTQIATDDDEIIIPFKNCFLRGDKRTRNLLLQDHNGRVVVTHQNIYNDPIAQEFVFDALDNPGPTKPGRALADFPPTP